MAISDAQYLAWLRASGKRRCVLVEAQAYSGGSVVTRYASNLGYVSTAADTPASTAYPELVLSVPAITARMAEVFRGRSMVSFGDIELSNAGGSLDAWTLDAWDGRPCKIYLGDPSWPKSDFRLAWSGTLADVACTPGKLVLKVRDRQALLDVPAQANRVTGGTNAGAKRPICYGRCYNITPVLRDAPSRVYEVHDGQISAVLAVYMDGATLTAGTHYTADLANGTITMLVAVTGRLTADVAGSKTGGVYTESTGDLLSRILQERAGFASGDIDAASVTALNTDLAHSVGLYESSDGATVRSLLDRLITGAGAYYTIDRSGVLVAGQFKAPSGTPAVTLGNDDVKAAGVELLRRMVPSKSVRVGYKRNYTVMQSSISGSVTEDQRDWLNAEFALSSVVTNSVSQYLLATDGELEPTCLAYVAGATAEATRRAALWGSLRRTFRVQAFLAAGQVRIGSVIALDVSRFGLSGGVLAVVTYLRESLTGGWQELEVFI